MQHPLDIHDLIEDLTRTHTHRESYAIREAGTTWTKGHVTAVPALVHQLLGATPASQATEGQSPGYGSRPAGRLEAIDTLMLIDDEAARWIRNLGEDDPGDTLDPSTGRGIPGSGTIACLNKLHGLHASATNCGRLKPQRDKTTRKPTCCTAHLIEHDIRRWWHQARIVSGWDSAAWRPDNTCPVCDQRRTLRINLTTSSALCVDCREVWDDTTLGLLAEHIRSENADEDTLDLKGA